MLLLKDTNSYRSEQHGGSVAHYVAARAGHHMPLQASGGRHDKRSACGEGTFESNQRMLAD